MKTLSSWRSTRRLLTLSTLTCQPSTGFCQGCCFTSEGAKSLERRQMQTVFYDILVNHQTLDTNSSSHCWRNLVLSWVWSGRLHSIVKNCRSETFANQEEILDTWSAFMDFRGQAQRALEEARNEKVIGVITELTWQFIQTKSETLLGAVDSNVAQLLIVSELTIAEAQLRRCSDLWRWAFTVERAAGEVCDRCRRIDPTTAERHYHATICDQRVGQKSVIR